MLKGLWLGVDLGGTRTKSVVLKAGEIIDEGTTDTVRGSAEDTVNGLADTVSQWLERYPEVHGVGITIPGLFDEHGCAVILPNVPGHWPGQPITGPVSQAVGRPVTLINDARAFGLAELTIGAARGAKTAAGVVLGTGVGGVIIINGAVHLGAGLGAGEIGHQVIVPDGPECGCGNRGCLETVAQAGAIAKAAGQPSAKQAAQAAQDGDPAARAAFADAGRYLGHGLANVVTVFQPEVVIIGGGVARAGDLLINPLTEQLRRMTPLVPPSTYRVVVGTLGPFAGAAGAALAAGAAAGT